MLKEKVPHPAFSYLIYLGCAIAFFTIPFGSATGRDIFYICSYISFIALCLNFKYFTRNKKNLILPLCFFAVGMASVLWVFYYKQPGEYIDLYRAYQASGKLQIATAFILLIALNERICMQRGFIIVALAAGLSVNIYSLYQGIWLNIERIELNFDRATIAAYLITAINLVMLQAILMLRTKFRIFLYVIAFLISFSALVLTGTRAAMLVYPVAVGLSILATKNLISSKHKIMLVTAVPLLLVASGLIFKSQIETRIEDFKNDLKMIDKPQVNNSIISRISMQIIGVRVGTAALLGQSAEQRGLEARAIVSKEPNLYGAIPYINVHLHNELLETYSIKGIWGVILLLALYVALFFSAIKPYRNALLLGVTFSLFAYGLSDVIFFSTEGTAMLCLAIIASILSVKKKTGEQE
ncbi:O-antigen ligase family protein [Serratia oryzae]|uniref:O-antigen ligase family protein n=1 Tax=Serratia oryzae TaxID=2034155 RepID=UPI0012E111C0|nr:O-antigen ligase family protein [Serratia oryzae]VXD05352.1 Ligase [Enterobacterales bacterium 8AC]